MEIKRFPGMEEMSRGAADLVLQSGRQAFAARGRFSLVLSGGNTPQRLFELLRTEPYASGIDWANTHVFFADERCVPPRHRDSNYRMAYTALLSKVPVPSRQVYRICGEMEPATAAMEYDGAVREHLHRTGKLFDLVLLGVGADGHTASLFPGDDALKPGNRLVLPATAPASSGATTRHRITLTLPALNASRLTVILASVAGKEAVLDSLLSGDSHADGGDPVPPAGLIRPMGEVYWFLAEETS